VAELKIAFLGSGSIARSHAYALSALPFYYADAPRLRRWAVASPSTARREEFAHRFGFEHALAPEDLWRMRDIDALFIATPNDAHAEPVLKGLEAAIPRIYVEKPLCVTSSEEEKLASAATRLGGARVQVGFQFLQMSAVRTALRMWRETPQRVVHFAARYLHGSYLKREYRDQKRWRLLPAPAGGALVDLGSHVLSMLVAFLGEDLDVLGAAASGFLPDVPEQSDLCSTLLLRHRATGGVGTVVASRVSAGAGDLLEFELRSESTSVRFSTQRPDGLEVFRDPGGWQSLDCGCDYRPQCVFPSAHTPSGWLRSLVHAHYVFFGGEDPGGFVPDLRHGVTVQRLARTAIDLLQHKGL
jgi:predicted dehydrogenase